MKKLKLFSADSGKGTIPCRRVCINITAFLMMATMMTLTACRDNDVRNWSDEEIEKWFAASPWAGELGYTLADPADLRQFAVQAAANSASWDAAFKFLKENDINGLKAGRYDICEDGTYAMVTDYMTRDSSVFEAHRKFIDIQHMSKGREYIDVAPLGEVSEYVEPYDGERDIEFFEKEVFVRVEANPSNYLVLFPSDAHRPCISMGEKDSVRKIVIKIPFMEQL